MDAKLLTKFGLMLMTPEVREERLNGLMDGNVIDGKAVAALIDEARDACYILTEREVEGVDEHQKIQIRWMLSKINGADEVQNMVPEELVDWVIGLREDEKLFTAEELMRIAKVLMQRE